MSIVFGYRTDVGAIGGRLLVVESFIDLVLIALPWPVPTSIWRLLPYRRTRANGAPAGWAVGMGAGASRAAQELASGRRGGAWQVPVGSDRFEVSVRAPQLLCPEARRRRQATRRAGERRKDVRRSADDCGRVCIAASGRERCPRRLWADAQPRDEWLSVCSMCTCML